MRVVGEVTIIPGFAIQGYAFSVSVLLFLRHTAVLV